ncbi:hypothetical protein CP960_12475 [Malaciobacter halophilus]|uniref:Chemotaxis protein n=1 Tax=Malaciobacter halophilus TaxID=197482 RepID=A0A2N1IZU2_9BACT|nr:hypothetical protein [Malaciobacter halophilus]AXH10499.1 hypothetical protein AHALO_2158 [Malaciobacter halophilus]PKI79819.1 hypothetical protein CP960_12475 [Malaciobacter halophilus]
MSMSQEEIESLMNGLDLDENENSEEVKVEESAADEPTESYDSNEPISNDDIDKLLAEADDAVDTNDKTSEQSEPPSDDELDDILANIDDVEDSDTTASDEDIDELLKGIDGVSDDTSDSSSEDSFEEKEDSLDQKQSSQENEAISNEDNFDDILAGIDGITDNEPVKQEKPVVEDKTEKVEEKSHDPEEHIVSKIDEGIFPLPAEKDTKVVNQLSQVANDSEEKASKIFDVLSYVLDDNNDVQKSLKNTDEFLNKQTALLESLNKKFPNISIFDEQLKEAAKIKEGLASINGKLDAENMQIFEAMELMQFHDINRQKIERVMAVIRKLSIYLNNLFEDEGSHQEIAVARHIHGDSTADVLDDADLESLISEFGN